MDKSDLKEADDDAISTSISQKIIDSSKNTKETNEQKLPQAHLNKTESQNNATAANSNLNNSVFEKSNKLKTSLLSMPVSNSTEKNKFLLSAATSNSSLPSSTVENVECSLWLGETEDPSETSTGLENNSSFGMFLNEFIYFYLRLWLFELLSGKKIG